MPIRTDAELTAFLSGNTFNSGVASFYFDPDGTVYATGIEGNIAAGSGQWRVNQRSAIHTTVVCYNITARALRNSQIVTADDGGCYWVKQLGSGRVLFDEPGLRDFYTVGPIPGFVARAEYNRQRRIVGL